MPRMRLWLAALLLSCASGCRDGRTLPSPSGASSAPPNPAASAAHAGEKVRLRATKPDGVPLHPTERAAAISARLADGSEVEVLTKSPDGSWLEVRAADGTRGWLTRRYLAGAGAPVAIEARDAGPSSAAESPWASRGACERALSEGRRLPKPEGTARFGTWNVRWFPDGKPGKGADGGGTDLPWLACIVAWSNVDALAVQEFKTNARARLAMTELLGTLDRHTRGKWAAAFDDCPNTAAQHVGVIYDARRVAAKGATTVAAMNPHGEACKDSLRPGFSLHLTLPGGLDLHFVSIHSKSGSDRRSLDLRNKSISAIVAAHRALLGVEGDSDVLLAGDFNTMGCKDCSPAISATDELASTDRALGALSTRYRRIPASATCSEYYRGHGTLLDHFVASASFAELGAAPRTRVSGRCGDSACAAAPAGGPGAAERELSDHCPLFLDVADRDLD